MLLWMALLRKLPEQIWHFATFNRDGLTGAECAGRNLLVVGVGHVGGEVVKIGSGLGMNVRRVDIIPERADTSIETGLPWADVVVCAMNLTPRNRGYFNEARLRLMKRGAIFVNVARGEMSPTADLARLLDDGHLGGVGLDVYDHERELAVALRAGRAGWSSPPQTHGQDDGALGQRALPTAGDGVGAVGHRALPETPPAHPALKLIGRANVILTPHNAFNTHEAVERKSAQTVESVVRFLKHGRFPWAVMKDGEQHDL